MWLTQLAEKHPGIQRVLSVQSLLDLRDWTVVPQGGHVKLGKLYFIHGDTLPNTKSSSTRVMGTAMASDDSDAYKGLAQRSPVLALSLLVFQGQYSTNWSAQAAALTTAQVAALTTVQLGALTTVQLPALTTAQAAALTTTQVQGLNQGIIQGLGSEEIQALIAKFAQATERAARAGFDAVELHGAHGYLVHAFLSPISNQRKDEYGGSLENRMRFCLEVFEAGLSWALILRKRAGFRTAFADFDPVRVATFTERDVRVSFIRADKGATMQFGTEPSSEVLFMKEGKVTHDNSSYDDKPCSLVSAVCRRISRRPAPTSAPTRSGRASSPRWSGSWPSWSSCWSTTSCRA